MWQPDTARNACNRCGNEFTFFNRKHHCRHCGNLYDDACSNFYVPINNPIAPPGIFSTVFADKNSGVHRICHGCYHRFYAYICVTQGFWGMSTELFGSEDDAKRYMEEQKNGIIVHIGTAKIVLNKSSNDPASTAKFLEKAKGKARKIMGETFYEDQALAQRGVLGPAGTTSYQQQLQAANKQQPAAITPSVGATNNINSTNNSNFAQNERDEVRRRTNNNNNNNRSQNDDDDFVPPPSLSTQQQQQPNGTAQLPLPQFCYVVCICLSNGARRLRFLQPDVHNDKAKLVLDVQKLAKEEFEAAGKFIDQVSFVEAVVLLNTDWKTPLLVETARFFYREQPYIDTTIEQVMKTERFVICAHRGGRHQCEVIQGGAEARQRLFDNASPSNNISSVVVAATGEPIGHTCRDVSWRRDLVDRADAEGLKLLYGAGASRLVFVASTIPSANCDVRTSQTLWDLEQATQGQIRTTTQGWIWDKELVDKLCIVSPFLGGSLAPPSATPAQLDTVTSTLRKLFVQSKSAAPIPTEGGAAAAASLNSTLNNTTTTGGSQQLLAASSSSTSSANNKPQNNNNSNNGLAQAPPRPGATAAASTQAQKLHATTPPPSASANIPECNICMENFDTTAHKPLILSCCGHSICNQCWQEILERRQLGAENVPCPRCREELPVSQRLVPNRTLLEQIS